MKLEAGKTYLNRIGERVTVEYIGNKEYPFIGGGHSFKEDGSFLSIRNECLLDLISEVIESKEKDFVLPKKWCIRQNACQEACDWHKGKFGGNAAIDGNKKYLLSEKDNAYKYSGIIPNGYIEITKEQFLTRVLNKKEMKQIGWKLKDDCKQYEESARKIAKCSNFIPMGSGCSFYVGTFPEKYLKEAGVLELWFELVYEKEETYKVGDWIYIMADYCNDTLHKEFKKDARKGDAIQIDHFSDEFGSGNSNNLKVAVSKYGQVVYIESYPKDFRKATPQEIEEAAKPKEIIHSVGGKFDVKIKHGKIWHKSDDITEFVKNMMNMFEKGRGFAWGGYEAFVIDVKFSRTGCQHIPTSLSAWKELWKVYQETVN